MIIESENDYIGALKGNQSGLLKVIKNKFIPKNTFQQISKGHGQVENRHVSICQILDCIPSWSVLTTLIQVRSERQVFTHDVI